jgi:hypothetical protein
MGSQLRISAAAEELGEIRQALLQDPDLPRDAISLTNVAEQASGSRRPLGFEPLSYFIVVFAAHLSADATKALVRLIARKLAAAKATVTEETTESE